jgi:hypothetical protein
MNDLGHTQARALIARHFSGTIQPGDERALRQHLPDCAACRANYQRQLWLSRLDPKAPTAEARLGRALGLRAPRKPLFPVFVLAPTLAAAALGGLFLSLRADTGFQARGVALAPQATTRVYRLRPGQRPAEVADQIGAEDELAFSYENSSDNGYLMIFGIDEAGRVYWYYPAWTDAAQNPSSLVLPPSPAPHELPEAVRQRLLGHQLNLCHFFSNTPWTVKDVEARIARAGGPPSDLAGIFSCRKLAVAP